MCQVLKLEKILKNCIIRINSTLKRKEAIMPVKRVLKGVADFLKREKRVIDSDKIKSILPHSGRMLLLDEVTITKKKIEGTFKVTEEVCEGHAVYDGQLVFKGSDFFDMAAQLLGIWGAQHPDFEGKICVIRKYGGAKFANKATFPGDLLKIELEPENAQADVFTSRNLIIMTGENFLATVDGEKRADISSVELVALNPNEEA